MGGMSAELQGALERIAERVELPTRARARISGPKGAQEVDVAAPGGPAAGLSAALYGSFYIVPQPAEAATAAERAAFLETLRAANPVRPRLEAGWTVVQADGSGVTLADARGAQRRAGLGEVVPYAGGLAPGQPVRLAAVRETVTGANGHYVIFGRPVRDARGGTQVRFYWNVAANGAAALLTALGGPLERRRIPFQAKVPCAPDLFGRSDCGVLYLNIEDVEASLDIVAAAKDSLAPFLRPDTPLFARRLAPGVSFAESPLTGDSFGMQRCRLVAEGLLTAFDRGLTSISDRVAAIAERFEGYGIDLAAPERNPATCYPYRIERIAA